MCLNLILTHLSVSSLVTLEFREGIGVIVPLFNVTLCILMLHYLRLPRFPFLLLLLVGGGGDDDLLMYTITSPAPTLAPVFVKPPITQVYSRNLNPPAFSLTPIVSSSDPV